MDTAFSSALAPIRPTKRAAARLALVDLAEPSQNILAECFRQYGIEPLVMAGGAVERLHKEKFEACVLRLRPGVEKVMEAIRTCPSNSRMVIYRLGVNA